MKNFEIFNRIKTGFIEFLKTPMPNHDSPIEQWEKVLVSKETFAAFLKKKRTIFGLFAGMILVGFLLAWAYFDSVFILSMGLFFVLILGLRHSRDLHETEYHLDEIYQAYIEKINEEKETLRKTIL